MTLQERSGARGQVIAQGGMRADRPPEPVLLAEMFCSKRDRRCINHIREGLFQYGGRTSIRPRAAPMTAMRLTSMTPTSGWPCPRSAQRKPSITPAMGFRPYRRPPAFGDHTDRVRHGRGIHPALGQEGDGVPNIAVADVQRRQPETNRQRGDQPQEQEAGQHDDTPGRG